MKRLLLIILLLTLRNLYAQQVGGNSPISVANDATCTGCVNLPVKVSIDNAQANGTDKGAATFTINDFNSSSGLISIDYTNGQAAGASQNGFVNQSDQAFTGRKTFNGGVGLALNQTILYNSNVFIHTGGGDDESLFVGILAGNGSSSNGTTAGHGNVGIGVNALFNLDASNAIGAHNTAIGYLSMEDAVTAKRNTFVGSTAGQSLTVAGPSGTDVDLATENTGMGWQVLLDATSASYNSVFGSKSGFHITSGNSNTLIGVSSGGGITTGSSNIMIGYQAGAGTGATTSGYNNVLIGNNVIASSASAHDETNLGDFLYHTLTGAGFGDQSPDDFFTIGNNSQVQFSSSGTMLTTANIILNKTGTGVFICGSTTQSYRTTNAGSNINFQAAFDVDNSASSAGAKAFGFDPTNGFVFTHANGTRRIAGAAITITNLDNTSGSEDADLSFYTQAAGAAITERLRITNQGGIVINATNTSSGTTGAQTINKPSGTVNFAAGATSLVVTNSLVTANSLVFATIRTNDATALIKNVVSASGSFTINLNAAATAETSVGFFVVN